MSQRIMGTVVFACALLLMLFGASLLSTTGTQAGAPVGAAVSSIKYAGANSGAQTANSVVTGVWTDTAPLPTITLAPTPGTFPLRLKRAGAACYQPNGKCYLMGGRHGVDGEDTNLRSIWEYTPGSPGSWVVKSALLDQAPVGSRWTANMAVAVLTDTSGPRIYAIGGNSVDSFPTPVVRVYDPGADSISTLPAADNWPATPARVPGGYAVFNNKLYIFGGFTSLGNGSVFTDTWQFDPMAPSGQRWTQLATANLNRGRGYIAGGVLDGKIYAIGGDTWDPLPRQLLPSVDVERMDPLAPSPSWTRVADLPTARGDLGAWAYDSSTNYEISGHIAVAGGIYPVPDDRGYIYTPGTNSWATWGGFAHSTRNYGVAQLAGYLYAFGGYDYSTGQPRGANFNQRYDATSPQGTPTNTPTGSPPTATRTPTTPAFSSTPTATPTVCGQANFVSTDVPRKICDLCTVTSTLQVAGVGTITDVDVRNLNISHTYIDDLIITLTSPDNTTVTLFNRDCGSDNDIPGIHYDDEASGPIACPPVAGASYRPSSPLSGFDGHNANGRWVLTISDTVGQDFGTLNAWGLRFTLTNCGTPGTITPTFTPTPTATRGTPSPSPTSICPPLTVDVTIQNFVYLPAILTVYQGTTVRWTNMDTAPHTSTSDTAIWDSGNLTQGQTYSRRFDNVGTFPYHCALHPTMTANVVVRSGCPPALTPTRTVTSTPVVSNTPTVTPTSTICVITFSDVLPTEYFYEGVRWLYCRGAISGYGDGTFKPYNNTTRGQMVKIVVLAYGIPTYTPPTPTFNDVSTANPFYQHVETAAHSQIVSGYNCGGTGEPCPGMYFRPNGLVTRGQLSKIIVAAAGWSVLDPTNATFNDVPRGNTFYTFIETAFCHQVLVGYTCGGPGEPCPGKYFRPGNNAIRGQIAKMVHNAVSNLPCVGPTPTATPTPVQVNIQNNLFAPANITIPVGGAVRWTNLDKVVHTSTSSSTPVVWDSGDLALNQSFTFIFNTAGTYPYLCTPHPFMTGTITVSNRITGTIILSTR